MEGFQEGHEDAYDVSRQSAFFDYLSYFTYQIWRTSLRIVHSQAYYGLSTTACPPIPTWSVNKATSLSRYLAEQGLSTWHNLTTMWMTLWGLSHWETPNNPTQAYDDIKVAFLTKKWNFFHLLGEETSLQPPQECSQIRIMNVNCTWSIY